MKLTDARNAKEVLPGKKIHPDETIIIGGKISRCPDFEDGFNAAIEAYNNVRIVIDEAVLFNAITKLSYELKNDLVFSDRLKISRCIIESMPTWIVVKKGGV